MTVNTKASTAVTPTISEDKKRTVSLRNLASRSGKLKILGSPSLIIGIFIILYAGLTVAYLQHKADARDMQSQIARQQTTLSMTTSAPKMDQGKTQLADSQAELARSEDAFNVLALPHPEQAIAIYDEIMYLAQTTGLANPGANLAVTKLTATYPTITTEQEDMPIGYSLTMSGSRDGLLAFLSTLSEQKELLGGLELGIAGFKGTREASTLTLDMKVHIWPDPLLATGPAPAAAGRAK